MYCWRDFQDIIRDNNGTLARNIVGENIEINDDGSIDITGDLSFRGSDFSKLPFKINVLHGNLYIIKCSQLATLENFPIRMRVLDFEDPTRITFFEYRRLLITDLGSVEFFGDVSPILRDVSDILIKGRENRIMPSELIPGKIKQLKDLEVRFGTR